MKTLSITYATGALSLSIDGQRIEGVTDFSFHAGRLVIGVGADSFAGPTGPPAVQSKSYDLHYWAAHHDKRRELAAGTGFSPEGSHIVWRGRTMVADSRLSPKADPVLCVGPHTPGEEVNRVLAHTYWLAHSEWVLAHKDEIPHVNGLPLVWNGRRVWTDDRAKKSEPALCIWPPGSDGLHAFVYPDENPNH